MRALFLPLLPRPHAQLAVELVAFMALDSILHNMLTNKAFKILVYRRSTLCPLNVALLVVKHDHSGEMALNAAGFIVLEFALAVPADLLELQAPFLDGLVKVMLCLGNLGSD